MAVQVKIVSTRSKFFIAPVRDRINRQARINVRDAAELLMRDTVQNISRGHSPPASVPGEFPHVETGELSRSAKVEQVNEPGGIYAAVVFTAAHAGFVEKMRPFLSRTMESGKRRYAVSLTKRLFGMFQSRQ